jgi:hypothetical protein
MTDTFIIQNIRNYGLKRKTLKATSLGDVQCTPVAPLYEAQSFPSVFGTNTTFSFGKPLLLMWP